MSQQFFLYTRGFVGSVEHATESAHQVKARALLSVFDLEPEAVRHAVVNEQIVQGYNQMARRQVMTTDFAWRERIIRAGLRAFGTRSVKEWIAACEKSPTFTQTHADCIADWVRFCTTGTRRLPPLTWERLISAGVNDPASPAQVCEKCVASLPSGWSNILNTSTGDNNLHNLVSMALQRPGGFTDLLTTLYVFFGESNANH